MTARSAPPPRWVALAPTLTGLGMLLTLASGAYDDDRPIRWLVAVLALVSLGGALVVLLWPRRRM